MSLRTEGWRLVSRVQELPLEIRVIDLLQARIFRSNPVTEWGR